MKKTVIIVVGAIVIAGLAFGGGYLVATKTAGTTTGTSTASGRSFNARGGPFANLTAEERQKMQSMTEEERRAFLNEKGIDLPEGMPNAGTDGGGFVMRGGPGGTQMLEGKVTLVDSEKLTIALSGGGSATVYVDAATVRAAVSGADPELVKDANVYVFAQPEAEGVTAAKVIVVK